ncbi:MAG: hypothetical protein SPE65_04915, partial [Muribaculaceae bacterium]|nr:hypothetical protein [Muribaculaceae bacterium]
DFYSLFNNPEKDWEILLGKASDAPPDALAFRLRGLVNQKNRLDRRIISSRAGYRCASQLLSDSNNNFSQFLNREQATNATKFANFETFTIFLQNIELCESNCW